MVLPYGHTSVYRETPAPIHRRRSPPRSQSEGTPAMTAAIERPRWKPALALAAGLLFAATACSSGSAATKDSASTSLDSMTTAQLAAAAAKEGTVTWYTTFS